MDRLQKKCVVASIGFHLLLVVILFVGPAFLSAPKKSDIPVEMTFFNPDILTANGPSGGGHPAPGPPVPPQAAPPTPTAQHKSEPEKVKDPDPPKETKAPKLTKTDAESYEVKKSKLSPESLKMVSRSNKTSKTTKKTTTSTSDDQEQKQLADSRRRIGEMLRNAASGMNASSATKIDDPGPGGGGPTYASYASLVQMIYWDAWAAPEDATAESAVVDVSVTISNDGSVISSRVIKRSGDGGVDASVQRTLNRVTTMGRPFPEGMKEKQRTYILHFDLKAKKGLA